jgi:hypothetical protein
MGAALSSTDATCDGVDDDCSGSADEDYAPLGTVCGEGACGGTGTTSCSGGHPKKCKPCTQVPSCLNTCEHCELCVGKTTLPDDCSCQACAAGQQLCGEPCGAPCPDSYFCKTGRCVPAPR